MAAVEDQLAYEGRVRQRQAVLAWTAGVLPVLGVVILLGGPKANVSELTLNLITDSRRTARDIIGTGVSAIGYFALAATLSYLFRATKARNPAVKPGWTGTLAIAGGVLAGASGVVNAIVYSMKAHDFVSSGTQTYPEANHLLSSAGVLVPELTLNLGLLLIAVGFVLTAMNAMRVGLLTRFMGYLGLFAGALVIIPLVPIPIVGAYWLVAVGFLIAGRWPYEVPLAWRTGQAERLPTSQELREAASRKRDGGSATERRRGPDRSPSDDGGADGPARTRATTPKRKRKRRR